MSGIGKTTLAKLVYDKIWHHFEVHCFLANVREVCAKNGIVDLAKRLPFPFLKERITEIGDEERVSILTEKFLHNKKVLLVLDDVDELKQLEVFAGDQSWFGMRSRIIVTTRNQRLLVQHGIAISHKVKGLNDAEALKLFCLHAFKKDQPKEDFLELSKYFINHAGGFPLPLTTLGSALFGRGLDAWNSVRDNLSKIPNLAIFDKLKISYDGLEEWEKSIFLDVACFHKGKYKKREIIQILDNSNSFEISSHIGIDVLIEKSIPYQNHHKYISMHDLIQEMAWTIIGRESKELGKRSRLWLYNDIFHVFMTNTGTGAIEAISVRLPKVEEDLPNLKHIDLGQSNKLKSTTPDFSGLPNLKQLIIKDCKNLVEIHPSIGVLKRLMVLFLFGCKSIKSLPSEVEMNSLKFFSIYGYSNVKRILEFGEQMKNVSMIDLGEIAIEKIPSSIGHLVGLKELYLSNNKKLLNLPRGICNLKSLTYLNMVGYSKIDKLPGDMDHIERLRWERFFNVTRIRGGTPRVTIQMVGYVW